MAERPVHQREPGPDGAAHRAHAAHVVERETETARLLKRGWWKVGTAYEHQTSTDGSEGAAAAMSEALWQLLTSVEAAPQPV